MIVQNARPLIEEFPDLLNSRTCPLILVAPDTVICASTKEEKRRAIERFDPAHSLLLAAWPGQWRTDIFNITLDDLLARGLRHTVGAVNG